MKIVDTLLEDIDSLIDESLAIGPVDDYQVNRYPRCPHCNRNWHGLPLTQRVATMYDWGHYEESYRVDSDDTPIVCPGSEFIGPLPPPSPDDSVLRYDVGHFVLGRASARTTFDTTQDEWSRLLGRTQDIMFGGLALQVQGLSQILSGFWMDHSVIIGNGYSQVRMMTWPSIDSPYHPVGPVRHHCEDEAPWAGEEVFGPHRWITDDSQQGFGFSARLLLHGATGLVAKHWKDFLPTLVLPPASGYDFTGMIDQMNEEYPSSRARLITTGRSR